jgi:hypothetical protein
MAIVNSKKGDVKNKVQERGTNGDNKGDECKVQERGMNDIGKAQDVNAKTATPAIRFIYPPMKHIGGLTLHCVDLQCLEPGGLITSPIVEAFTL